MVPVKKEKGRNIRVCDELIEIFEKIRGNVDDLTWGAEDKMSYYKCSKVLAQRVRKYNIYK